MTYTGIAGDENAIAAIRRPVRRLSWSPYEIDGAGSHASRTIAYVGAAAGEAHAVLLAPTGQPIGVGYDYFGEAVPFAATAATATDLYCRRRGGCSSLLLAIGRHRGRVRTELVRRQRHPSAAPGGATYVDVFSGGATTFLLTAAE